MARPPDELAAGRRRTPMFVFEFDHRKRELQLNISGPWSYFALWGLTVLAIGCGIGSNVWTLIDSIRHANWYRLAVEVTFALICYSLWPRRIVKCPACREHYRPYDAA